MNFASTAQKSSIDQNMKRPSRLSSPSFALISVLALVSLAALSATAFLASARLERQATKPLSQTLQLEMALATGEKCAEQTMADGIQASSGPNFVTTLYRGPDADDWTNELGYLFIGIPNSTKNLKWTYFAGFSPARLKKLDTNDIEEFIRWTNSQQGAFTSEISAFMTTATNGFSTNPSVAATSQICTLLPLLGGRTSPPVGWVYLWQDKRILGTTNTTNVRVARVAWFMEDLSGMIDAERMGATTNRSTGTNPEEISLINMLRAGGGKVLSDISSFTNTTNRKLFFTPGLLASCSGLTNTNDLRYFATGLREWRPTNAQGTNGTVSWIPIGIFSGMSNSGSGTTPVGYKDSGYLKMDINQLIAKGDPSYIAGFIRSNLPNFTNRAGGMNGTNYALALAANIIDYADTNSEATTTNINGANIVGYDNYPMLTQIFDKITYTTTPPQVSVETYFQLWNPAASATSNNLSCTFLYDFADTLFATGTIAKGPTKTPNNDRLFTNPLYTNSINSKKSSFSFTTNLPSISSNGGIVLSFKNTIPVQGATPPEKIWINGTNNGSTNTGNFTLRLAGSEVLISKMLIQRQDYSLTNGESTWKGTVPVLCYTTNGLSPVSSSIGDPRMLNFLVNTNNKTNFWASAYTTVNWYGYPAATAFDSNPGNWPDGTNTGNISLPKFGQMLSSNTTPTNGTFSISDPPPCKISNFGSYTNILELGNIFDPVQWAPSASMTKLANCDIATNWTKNSLYGGGSTLRIGRAEHSLFAFTNLGKTPTSQPIPNTGQSAAALLDLFCISNPTSASFNGIYRTGGKINLNTAPAPVLAALAGGINLTKDTNKTGSEANKTMIDAFTNGVMRFRSVYPFLSTSQLPFISVNYGSSGWTNSGVWTNSAVFSTSTGSGLNGVTSLNDEGREEWLSKIYQLATVSSVNYRFYIAAQLVDTNGNGLGPIARKYCQYAGRPETAINGAKTNTSYGVNIYSWPVITGEKKVYESPY